MAYGKIDFLSHTDSAPPSKFNRTAREQNCFATSIKTPAATNFELPDKGPWIETSNLCLHLSDSKRSYSMVLSECKMNPVSLSKASLL